MVKLPLLNQTEMSSSTKVSPQDFESAATDAQLVEQPSLSVTHGSVLEKKHGIEVDYDLDSLNKLLDDMGIGEERSKLTVLFDHHIPSHDDSDPTGHYDPEAIQITIRVLKRKYWSYLWSRKRQPRNAEDINKDLIHETRHFFQHMGAIAAGDTYEWQTKADRKRIEHDAQFFTDQNHTKYPIIQAVRQRPTN